MGIPRRARSDIRPWLDARAAARRPIRRPAQPAAPDVSDGERGLYRVPGRIPCSPPTAAAIGPDGAGITAGFSVTQAWIPVPNWLWPIRLAMDWRTDWRPVARYDRLGGQPIVGASRISAPAALAPQVPREAGLRSASPRPPRTPAPAGQPRSAAPGSRALADGVGGGLHPVGEVQLLERVVDVVLDRALGDRQLVGDLLVGHAGGDELEDLGLAAGQDGVLGRRRRLAADGDPAGAQCLEELGRDRGGDRRLAAHHAADVLEQLLRADVLEQVAVGAGLDRLEQVVVVLGHGEHDDRRPDAGGADGGHAVHARGDGHVHVHDHEIGMERPDLLQGIAAVLALAHDGHVELGADQGRERPAEQGLVIDEQHPELRRKVCHACPLRRAGRRSSSPAFGAVCTSMLPPICSTRSRMDFMPKPPSMELATVEGSKPTPSSSIVSVGAGPRQSIRMLTRCACECLRVLVSASWTTRSSWTSDRGRQGAAGVALARRAWRRCRSGGCTCAGTRGASPPGRRPRGRSRAGPGWPPGRRGRPRRRSPRCADSSSAMPRLASSLARASSDRSWRWMTPRTWARLSWSSRAMRSRSAWIVHCSSASWRRAVRTAIEAMSARAPRRLRSWALNGSPGRTTHSSPRIPSGPRSGRAAQASPSILSGQRAERVARVLRRGLLVGDEARAAVVGHRQALAADRRAGGRVADVAQAHDGTLGAEEVAGVGGDRVEGVAEVVAARELDGDGVEGLALPLAAVEVRDGHAQLGRAGDLARDVRERGVGDVRLHGRMEGEAEVADAVRATDQREVEDAGVHAGADAVVRARPRPGPGARPGWSPPRRGRGRAWRGAGSRADGRRCRGR